MIFPTSGPKVARITGMSHWHPALSTIHWRDCPFSNVYFWCLTENQLTEDARCPSVG
jgi:hypothetical protein